MYFCFLKLILNGNIYDNPNYFSDSVLSDQIDLESTDDSMSDQMIEAERIYLKEYELAKNEFTELEKKRKTLEENLYVASTFLGRSESTNSDNCSNTINKFLEDVQKFLEEFYFELIFDVSICQVKTDSLSKYFKDKESECERLNQKLSVIISSFS